MNADCDGEFVVRAESVARYSQDASSVTGSDQNEVGGDSQRDSSHARGALALVEAAAQVMRDAQPSDCDSADDFEDDLGGADATAEDVPATSRKTAKPRVRTRRTRMRSKTIALKRLTRAELQRGALANPPVEDVERPLTRAECKDMPRPCPFVSCKHHLYLDINPRTGSIKINFPDLEPWELQHTCALDVADNGGLTLEEIGIITNLTRERVRQVEVRGLLTLQGRSRALR